VWYGKKTLISHLRVFGCNDFMHVPKENRIKLDNKGLEACMINLHIVVLEQLDKSFVGKLWPLYRIFNNIGVFFTIKMGLVAYTMERGGKQ